MKRGLVGGSLLAVVVAAAAAIWWGGSGPGPDTDGPPPTVTAARRDVVSRVLAPGKVLPQVGAEVNVGARISGKLERLLVGVGDRVAKDQVIAEVEKDDLLAMVRQREAEVAFVRARINALERLGPREIARSRAELADWQARLEFAEAEAKRHRELLGRKAVARQAWEEAHKECQVARARIQVARRELELTETRCEEDMSQLKAELAKAQASLAQAQVNLSYATIRAPLAGIVASVSTRQGETVAAGMNAPTFVTIIDPARLQVDVYVDEVDIGRVRSGARALFTVDAYPDREFQGRLSAILPKAVVNDNVVSYDCIIHIDTPYEGLLRPEMNANVTLLEQERKGMLVLPATALRMQDGRYLAYRWQDGKTTPVPVEVGWRGEEMVEITKGLSPGDQVLALPPRGGQEERP